MNAEEMKLARRFVACEGWAWLEGMQAVGVAAFGRHDTRSAHRIVGTFDGIPCATESVKVTRSGLRTRSVAVDDALADLSDALTRAGLLEVVRRAWGDETACVRPVERSPLPTVWVWEAGDGMKRQSGFAMTELHALLAALEAAPGV